MNSEIQEIFNNFNCPVSFLRYTGKETTYVVYMETDKDNSYSGNNELKGYVTYYDFDIYSKGNYLSIMENIKTLMKQNGWTWQPSRDSSDMFEADTGYYHKTLCFAKEIQIESEE